MVDDDDKRAAPPAAQADVFSHQHAKGGQNPPDEMGLRPKPPAGSKPAAQAEGVELPDGPGVWKQAGDEWLISFGGYLYGGWRIGIPERALTWTYREKLPRGGWSRLSGGDAAEREIERLKKELETFRTLAQLAGDATEAFAEWARNREQQTTWRPDADERSDARFFWSCGWQWSANRMATRVATEAEMHAAWRKRADEAERQLAAAQHDLQRLIQQIKGVQGALADAGTVLAIREDGDYGASVRALTKERDDAQQRLLTAAGDDLCRLSQEEIKAMSLGAVPIPPKDEFLASCERFHAQVAGEASVNHNCLTLAQLVAENERQRLQLAEARRALERMKGGPGTDNIPMWPSMLSVAKKCRELADTHRHTEAVAGCRHCGLKYAADSIERLITTIDLALAALAEKGASREA